MDWFRTDTGFSRHRDTVRLRKLLGLSRKDIGGHMLCLFEAVAEHEEYGDLSKSTPEVIEEWAEWPHDRAGEFDKALRATGWIDEDGQFAGWYARHENLLKAREEKKKWRAKKKSAARKAKADKEKEAAARPRTVHGRDQDGPRLSTDATGTVLDRPSDRTRPDPTGPSTDEHPLSAPPAPIGPDRVAELFEKWNALAKTHGLPTAAQISSKRRASAKARIADGLLDRWDEFAAALPLAMNGHYVGRNDRGWRADPKWLMREDAWLGIVESGAPKSGRSPNGTVPESADARRSRRLDKLTAAVFARVDFGTVGKIPRLFGDALVDLQCDERTIGIRRDPTGKLRDVRIEFVEVRLLDAMDADGVPDNGIAAWAAREVQIIHPPAAAQDRSGAA